MQNYSTSPITTEELKVYRDLQQFIAKTETINWAHQAHCNNFIVLHIFPSKREGFANAILETSACGIPTIAWNVTGVKDAIVQNTTGIKVKPFDINKFSQAIDDLINDRKLLYQMGKNAIHFIQNNYDQEIILENYAKFIFNSLNSINKKWKF